MTWKVDLRLEEWSFVQKLRIWRAHPDRIDVVQPLMLKTYDRFTVVPDDEIAMLGDVDEIRSFLQAVMDVAWKQGLRPTGFESHTNELTAVRYHLEDMRRLAMADRNLVTLSGASDLNISEAFRSP